MGVVRPFIAPRRGRLNRDQRFILWTRPLGEIVDDESLAAGLRLVARRLLREGDKEVLASKRQEFSMLFTAEHTALMRHLRLTSRHPMIAAELFSLCMREMDWDSGEVKLSRFQLASELCVKPAVVSRVMGELVKCGAMKRSFVDDDGNRVRSVRYIVSSRLATHERSSAAREASQADCPPLRLVGGTDVPTERRSRARSFVVPVL